MERGFSTMAGFGHFFFYYLVSASSAYSPGSPMRALPTAISARTGTPKTPFSAPGYSQPTSSSRSISPSSLITSCPPSPRVSSCSGNSPGHRPTLRAGRVSGSAPFWPFPPLPALLLLLLPSPTPLNHSTPRSAASPGRLRRLVRPGSHGPGPALALPWPFLPGLLLVMLGLHLTGQALRPGPITVQVGEFLRDLPPTPDSPEPDSTNPASCSTRTATGISGPT